MKQFLCSLWSDRKKRTVLLVLFSVVFLVIAVGLGHLLLSPSNVPASSTPTDSSEPKETLLLKTTQDNATSSVPMETKETQEPFSLPEVLAHGIDVSKWQGKIDWAAVKASGVDFAMIRLGSVGECGQMEVDEYAVYNLQQAEKNGVLAGVYVFSGAETSQEAKAEADWVLSQIAGFAISYPVVLDWEMGNGKEEICASARTDLALVFLEVIREAGYEAMLYAPLLEFENPTLWQADRILNAFPVWVARYTDSVPPDATYPPSTRRYAMWQYTDRGSVSGIKGNVDRNFAYFSASFTHAKDASQSGGEVTLYEEFENQTFSLLSQQMTAKQVVNLRSAPSTESEILGQLEQGQWLLCTGKSNLGWARLELNGRSVYAIYSYLSTELGKDSGGEAAPHSFQSVREEVTAKEEVNLRAAPSEDAEIVGKLVHGEILIRTGLGDRGWDRLQYGEQTVYAVHSFLKVPDAA